MKSQEKRGAVSFKSNLKNQGSWTHSLNAMVMADNLTHGELQGRVVFSHSPCAKQETAKQCWKEIHLYVVRSGLDHLEDDKALLLFCVNKGTWQRVKPKSAKIQELAMLMSWKMNSSEAEAQKEKARSCPFCGTDVLHCME